MLKEFFQKYTNLFGSLFMFSTAITGWLASQGCLATNDVLTSTCTITWLPQSFMPVVTGIFMLLTLVGKLTRPGGILRSMVGSTAVVVPASSPKSTAGTVTPQQVAQP